MKKLGGWYNSIPSTVVIGGLLTLIIGVAAFLRFYQIGNLSFWNDEIATMNYATRSLKGIFQVVWKYDPNMSLYYLLVHYWVQIFPNASEGMLRALSAILSVASIPMVFLLGRSMGANRKQATAIGVVAALLVTLNAYHIQYAQELRSYSLVFLLATLSTFLLIKAIEQPAGSPNDWWIWYAIVSAAAVYSHFFAVFVLIAQAASLLVLLLGSVRTFPFKGIVGSGIAMAVLIAAIAVAAVMRGKGGIAWISEPTLSDVRNFAIKLTGKQGEPLLALYLLLGSIGLLAGARAWLRKNLVTKWNFTLMASCLFLPVAIVLVLSKVMTPIFMPYYLLFVLPYLAVLAAVGIVTLASLGCKSRKLLVITIPVGIAVLVLTLALSATGVKSYFETFQKEDFRGVAQFLAADCPEGLRLYDVVWMERNVTYYNANLKSQVEIWQWNDKQRRWTWNDKLSENPSSEELAEFLQDGYNQACLVLGHIVTPEEKAQSNIVQTALRMRFPNVTRVEFYGLNVEVYEKVPSK